MLSGWRIRRSFYDNLFGAELTRDDRKDGAEKYVYPESQDPADDLFGYCHHRGIEGGGRSFGNADVGGVFGLF